MKSGFSKKIIKWYQVNKRDLPWRETNDPYLIWISEVILQQTRVDQGLPYYYRFVDEFPNVKALASASEDEVLTCWQGLGYYSRGRNLHKAAISIVNDHNGDFPDRYEEIVKLNGVGPYTAAAISSFAFNEVQAVVDGNVNRVLSRYFGIEDEVNSSPGIKKIKALADELIDTSQPAEYNQAIMEFGALQCVANNPMCNDCVLVKNCIAFQNNLVDTLPRKKTSKTKTDRFFDFFLFINDDEFLIEKRDANDIWKGLYQLPMNECNKKVYENDFDTNNLKEFGINNSVGNTSEVKEYKHILSHQRLHARFRKIECDDKSFLRLKKSFKSCSKNEISTIAFPALITKYLNECFK